ncbi:MAG: prepilin-type N-terminal cleavage/methylation domain-containing protein [bacterium]|nr:prepilin-type N-terminal cleavage/methylation domain-containing protein [bacterium]
MFKKSAHGFTLIELIVVVVLLGIINTIAISSVRRIRDRAKITAAEADVNCMRKALSLFDADYSTYDVVNKTPNGDGCIIADYNVFVDNVVDPSGKPYMTLPDTSNFTSFSYTGNANTFTLRIKAKDLHKSIVFGNPDGAYYFDYRKAKMVSSRSTLTSQKDTDKETNNPPEVE